MNGLMKRLKKIQDECVDKQGAVVQQGDDKADEFTRLKKKLAAEVKNIRQLIHDRDDMEQTAPGTVATVELSHQIRSALKEVRQDAVQLDKMQKDEKTNYMKKNKEDKEKEQLIERREEIVGTVFDHIEECKMLDQKRHGDSAFSSRSTAPKDPLITQLPDIDDGDFQLLRKNDQVIDGMLDNVAAGVNELREIAQEMGKTADQQGIMLDNLDARVDKVNDQLENINIRLRKALESIRKGDRFILDIILLCVLLGLIGYIYSIVKK
jgi:SYP7 family syntaxin